MNIVERGKEFLKSLRELADGSARDWKQCPHCGSKLTIKNGGYTREPWFFAGRREVQVQRHVCHSCHKSYSEQMPDLVQGSWYAREVHRAGIDYWMHGGTSLRRTAEFLRSWMGKQERWLIWRPLDKKSDEPCYLTASTIHYWLDRAGVEAKKTVPGQLLGIGEGAVLGTDGLWAKLKGNVQRVVLLVVDSMSGLIYPPVVAEDETSAGLWQRMFERAQEAGLNLDEVRAVTSDGAQGLHAYIESGLEWVRQQRCVWHVWRNLSTGLAQAASAAAQALTGEEAKEARKRVRDELGKLIHRVSDAQSYDQAEAALAALREHPQGAAIGTKLNVLLDEILTHWLPSCRGVYRVSPEWYWRDFRQRLSHGRNHRTDQRLERATLVWAIYHNFEPAQRRSERKRHYRHPGQSALEVAGVPPGQVRYLDALGV